MASYPIKMMKDERLKSRARRIAMLPRPSRKNGRKRGSSISAQEKRSVRAPSQAILFLLRNCIEVSGVFNCNNYPVRQADKRTGPALVDAGFIWTGGIYNPHFFVFYFEGSQALCPLNRKNAVLGKGIFVFFIISSNKNFFSCSSGRVFN